MKTFCLHQWVSYKWRITCRHENFLQLTSSFLTACVHASIIIHLQISNHVGLLAGEPGCTTNIFIIEGHSERDGKEACGKHCFTSIHEYIAYLTIIPWVRVARCASKLENYTQTFIQFHFRFTKTTGSWHGLQQRENQMKCAPFATAVEWKFEY